MTICEIDMQPFMMLFSPSLTSILPISLRSPNWLAAEAAVSK